MSEVVQDRIVDGQRAVRPVSSTSEPGGLAGWVLGMIRSRSVRSAERHLQVVETLALGGRRQLVLVSCDGERFLVGSGADRVETIVRVGAAKPTEDSWV